MFERLKATLKKWGFFPLSADDYEELPEAIQVDVTWGEAPPEINPLAEQMLGCAQAAVAAGLKPDAVVATVRSALESLAGEDQEKRPSITERVEAMAFALETILQVQKAICELLRPIPKKPRSRKVKHASRNGRSKKRS